MNELRDKLITDNISEDECNLLFDELIRKPILNKVPTIHLADYPQLHLIIKCCWNYRLESINGEEALFFL